RVPRALRHDRWHPVRPARPARVRLGGLRLDRSRPYDVRCCSHRAQDAEPLPPPALRMCSLPRRRRHPLRRRPRHLRGPHDLGRRADLDALRRCRGAAWSDVRSGLTVAAARGQGSLADMFESAELGNTIDDATYESNARKLRTELLDAQYDLLADAKFP